MSTSADELVSQIKDLPDTEKQSRAHFHGLVRRSDGQIPAMMEIRFLSLANREVDDAVQW